MCGLVGCAGDLNKKEKEAFSFMLHLDVFRGKHSTGFASVGTDGRWSLLKRVGTAWDLFEDKNYATNLNAVSYALIGHNRAATKGRVNKINAHPFEMTDVVGAHNGTLRGQYRLPDNTRFEVDSENIFHSIQEQGLEATLESLDGAYALTYWDQRTEEVVLVRNDERDLYYCFSEDGKTVFWASEAWILSVALSKKGIKFQQINLLQPCHIYRFSFERKFNAGPVDLHIEEYEEPNFPMVGYGSSYGRSSRKGNTRQQGALVGQQGEKGKSKALRVSPSGLVHKDVEFTIEGEGKSSLGQPYFLCKILDTPSIEARIYISPSSPLDYDTICDTKDDTIFTGTVVSQREGIVYISPISVQECEDQDEDGDEEFVQGPDGKMLSFTEFSVAMKRGCCCCSETPSWEDAGELRWVNSRDFVCGSCQEMDWVQDYLEQFGESA